MKIKAVTGRMSMARSPRAQKERAERKMPGKETDSKEETREKENYSRLRGRPSITRTQTLHITAPVFLGVSALKIQSVSWGGPGQPWDLALRGSACRQPYSCEAPCAHCLCAIRPSSSPTWRPGPPTAQLLGVPFISFPARDTFCSSAALWVCGFPTQQTIITAFLRSPVMASALSPAHLPRLQLT